MSDSGRLFDIYLSYTGRDSYDSCPKQYEHRYIVKTKIERDARDSLFGSVIGKLFEWFYERKIWMDPDPRQALYNLVDDAVEVVTKDSRESEHQLSVVSNYGTDFSFIRDDLQQAIPGMLDTIRKYEFLTPYSRAEVDLSVIYSSEKFNLTMKLGGRADFIHSKDQRDIWILDGKGSKHREKYADPEQLIWYATQHYIKHHVAPTRLGFIFYKFPEDPVSWISYDEDALRLSLTKTFNIGKKIQLKMFDPAPSDECKLCDYKGVCPEGTKYLSAKKIDDRVVDSMFDIELL